MQRHIGEQNENVFKGVGYGLLLSAAISAGWIVIIVALF